MILACVLCSCGNDPVSISVDVSLAGWQPGERYSLNYYNTDTISGRNISVFIVHRRQLSPGEGFIPLTITTVTPQGKEIEEVWTFYPDLRLRDKTSVWHESRQLYRSDAVLGEAGEYTFTFSLDSGEEVRGIKAVGVEISRE